MVTDLILNAVLAVCNAAWSVVPDWSWPVPPQVALLIGEVTKVDAFAPVTELLQVSGVMALLLVALLGFKVVVLIVGWIRG